MENKVSKLAILTKGIIKENPVLVLLLGTCPTLATTSSALNGLGMGVSAMAVLICSNIVISLLAKIIPDKVRIPCYIVVIAGFVTVVQFVLQAFVPSLYDSLGLYHTRKSRDVRIKEQRSGFRFRRYRNGSWIYTGAWNYGRYQRNHRRRHNLRNCASLAQRSPNAYHSAGSGRILRICDYDCGNQSLH